MSSTRRSPLPSATPLVVATLLATGLSASEASPTCPGPPRLGVALESATKTIDVTALPGFAGEPAGVATLVEVDDPLHGGATVNGDQITYAPDPHFWSLRGDVLTYRYVHASDPRTVRTGAVQLIAGLDGTTSVFDDFEESSTGHCGWTEHDPADRLELYRDPAGGSQWLRISEAADPAFLSLVAGSTPEGARAWPSQCVANINHGTTDDCFTMRFAGAAPLAAPLHGEATILEAGFVTTTQTAESIEILLQQEGGAAPQVSARTRDENGRACATPWTKLGPHNATLRLDVWRDHHGNGGGGGGGDGAGMILRIDDRNAGLVRCVSREIAGVVEVRVGLVDVAGTAGRLDLDDVGIGERDVTDWQPSPGWTSDTFESGDLGCWATGGSEVPRVTSKAALAGVSGLAVDLGAIATSEARYGFVQQTAPEAARTFNLRFRLDPNSVDLLDGGSFVLASAADTAGHLKLWLRDAGAGLELRAEDRDDSGIPRATAWTALGDGAHTVELQWRAAAGPWADDGLVRLWIDGEERGEALGIDNDTRRVTSFRLGGVGVPPHALGVLHVDDVMTWD